jgi:tRNA threonylcarbamoyladenosine biosynthesis protein TsaE
MEKPKDIINLGYEEYFFGDGVSVIEWAERLKYLLPKDYLRVKLQVKGKDKRLLEFSASGIRHKELLQLIKEKL